MAIGGGDGGRHVARDRGRGRGDDRLHAGDVVGQAGLHLAAAGAGEEGDRLALQVAEDVGAQPVHDALADGGRHPGLDDAEQLRHDGDGEHAADGPEEQAHVLVGQRVVDDGTQQEGLGHRDDRDRDDDDGHDRRPASDVGGRARPRGEAILGTRRAERLSCGSTLSGLRPPRPPPVFELIHVVTSLTSKC